MTTLFFLKQQGYLVIVWKHARLWSALVLVSLCMMLIGPAPAHAVSAAQQRTDAFRSARCMFDLPSGVVDGRDVECGYVSVPERHGQREGPLLELAVAIIKSNSPAPAPDPLVMLQGGPGGSTIDTYATLLLRDHPLNLDRDIVLFDQRGTLYSRPALQCHESFDLLRETIEERLDHEEAQRRSLAATAACHDRLAREGVSLADYDSVENAADVEALRVALGYDAINLYGVSYGTLLALHVMRDYPAALRSVILDAVVPTQTNFIAQVPQSQERAFDAFFQACAADADCNATYPDLESTFFTLVDAWNKEPVHVALTDPQTGLTYQAVFDGDMLSGALFQMLYGTELIPALPKMIDDARAGNYIFLGRMYSFLLFDRTFSEGMYYSVVCAEDADFTPQDVPLDGVRPQIADGAREDAQAILDACQQWNVPPLEPIVDAPVVSDIPTLVFNGQFDPITPPAFGATAAQTLSRSYSFTFPNTGHSALLNDCPTSIARSFLADPQRPPDAACLAAMTPPMFITPANTLMAPSIQRVLATLNASDSRLLLPLLVLLLSLLVLLSLFLVWPVGWLIRVLSKLPADRRWGARVAPWLAALIDVLGLGFVVGAAVALFRTQAQNFVVLFYGLPRVYAPLFALPPLLVVLVAAMLVLTVLAWRRGFWSVWERLYYTLLTVGALGLAGVLLWWGVPGALVGL